MIAVGGATRLTDSGLSITEWQPLLGAIPPLTDADWKSAFEKYRQIPEYRIVNEGMSLAAFKFIYWWEWSHRFLGRFIGIAFALPLAWFWLSGAIPRGWHGRLVGVLLLGGLQGVVGWYMVKSGLVDRIDVSQYRLALHLTIAFVILAVLTWYILALGARDDTIYLHDVPRGTATLATILLALFFAQVVLGAFVAGTKAGLVFNSWPLMDGKLVPDGLLADRPWWINFTENHATIQFNHRTMAYVLIVLAAVQWVRLARVDDARVSNSALALTVMLLCQAGLGIWTLLAVDGRIPIWLGLAHQTFAALVLIVAVWHVFATRRAR
ncbi:MAG: COX15/CtaA family protein [Hyphomicrobiaceae bacterium]|nr:COX15/CtaA family protein [Hyphomicrobiaceae bacterium]